jgi:hypothetical protein
MSGSDSDEDGRFAAGFFAGGEAGGEPSQQQIPDSQPVADSYCVVSRVSLPRAAYASMPPGNRGVHDRLKPAFVSTFPNVHRFFDANSRAVAQVSWEFVSPEEIWAIVTSKLMGAGKIESMAWFKNSATAYVHSLLSKFVSLQPNDAAVAQKVTTACLSCFIQT